MAIIVAGKIYGQVEVKACKLQAAMFTLLTGQASSQTPYRLPELLIFSF